VNYGTLAALTGILTVTLIAYTRVPPRPRRWVQLLLLLPGTILLLRWAAYRMAWAELAAALAASLVLLWLWWTLVGRRLPAPHEGKIRVWTEEDPF
jgi:hypothetical protein